MSCGLGSKLLRRVGLFAHGGQAADWLRSGAIDVSAWEHNGERGPGNGTAAVQRAEHVIPSHLPPSLVERRGQFLISLAHGHALCGQDETAVTTLRRAHRTAPQETSLSREVHSVIGLMLGRERIGAAPGLRDLATAVGFKGTP
jgi:hypothetical protein